MAACQAAIARDGRAMHTGRVHVLLLAYYFPPDGGPGAQRPISFARHLPGLGARCTVLTRAIAAVRGRYDPEDPAAMRRLAERVTVVRAQNAATDWPALHRELVAAGTHAIESVRPDVILATMSPFSLWSVADELGRRHGLPAVYDLRDPWALDGVQDHRSVWHWRRQWQEMRRMLKGAAGVIANTEESRLAILANAPDLNPAHVTCITNGWEREDFPDPMPIVEPGETLDLVHGGSFLCNELYADERRLRRLLGWLRYRAEPIRPSGRTPLHLLRALKMLRASGHPAGDEVRLRVIGQADEALARCVAESGVADAVDLCGYRPHDEVVATLMRADALFLTLHGLPAAHRSRIVPGKTYEYLASGRPILAGLPGGDARELVATSPRAFLADPVDDSELAEQLVQLHRRWRDGEFRAGARPPDVERWQRGKLAGDLMRFLGVAIGGFG